MKFKKINSDIFFYLLRKKEYGRLGRSGFVYLDYTGGNLYPKSLVKAHSRYLQKTVYGNPHSSNPASFLSETMVTEARKKVLKFFNAQNYYCVFTNNASGALQIVGECYPFSSDSQLLLTVDNHNSVNGIREYCRSKGGRYVYSPMNVEDLSINETALDKNLHACPGLKNKLFAYPAQSNVSGAQHSLEWIAKAQEAGWDVLLDAAAFVPTSRLDLSVYHPDFVTLSFYKIFGYPTGIGCLLVKKEAFNKLKKASFAGGTITLSAVAYSSYFLKQDHEKFENGTINYLHIPAIINGLQFIENIGIDYINARIKKLTLYFIAAVTGLLHCNGRPLIKIYGPQNSNDRGGTFLLNFFDANGQQYPFQYVEQIANADKLCLRTGCFCNPGIDELNHGLTAGQLQNYFRCREHGNYEDLIQFLEKLRGAVRVSIGFPTMARDIKKFTAFSKKLLNKLAPEDACMLVMAPDPNNFKEVTKTFVEHSVFGKS